MTVFEFCFFFLLWLPVGMELNVLSVISSNVLWLTMYRQCTDLKVCNYKVDCMGTISVEAVEDTRMQVMSENQRKWYSTWVAKKKTDSVRKIGVLFTLQRGLKHEMQQKLIGILISSVGFWELKKMYCFCKFNDRLREKEWTKIL